MLKIFSELNETTIENVNNINMELNEEDNAEEIFYAEANNVEDDQEEPKKVPPLRILLPKTANEEDNNNVVCADVALLSPSNSARKPRGKHLTTSQKKNSTQRLTR